MAKVTVVSTLTSNFTFVDYHPLQPGQQLRLPRRRIRIFGGANTPNMKGKGDMTTDNEGVPLWTPAGIGTSVDEADIAWLKENEGFKAFMAAGNIKVMDREVDLSNDRIKRIVAAEMASADSHAPMTKNDARKGNQKLVIISAADND